MQSYLKAGVKRSSLLWKFLPKYRRSLQNKSREEWEHELNWSKAVLGSSPGIVRHVCSTITQLWSDFWLLTCRLGLVLSHTALFSHYGNTRSIISIHRSVFFLIFLHWALSGFCTTNKGVFEGKLCFSLRKGVKRFSLLIWPCPSFEPTLPWAGSFQSSVIWWIPSRLCFSKVHILLETRAPKCLHGDVAMAFSLLLMKYDIKDASLTWNKLLHHWFCLGKWSLPVV